MDVNFITTNKAGEEFERGRQRHDTERRQEEADFVGRQAREQTAGVDKAIREGIGAIYAKPKTSEPPAPPVAAPAPAGAPATAQTPASTPMPSVYPPNPTETGSALPQAASQPVSAPQPAPVAAAPAPAAPAPAPSAPAAGAMPVAAPAAPITNITPRAAPAARPQAGDNDLIARLARTPGAGGSVMTLHSANVAAQQKSHDEARADRDKGTELFIKAYEAGQPDVARNVATQYGLNIPPEMFGNKSFNSEMTRIANVVKNLKLTGEDAANFTHEALRTMPSTPETFDQQGVRYSSALQKVTGKKKIVETAGGIMQVPESGDGAGEYIKQPGTNKPAMPAVKTSVHVNAGEADKPTSEMKNAKWLIKAGVAKDEREAWDMMHTVKTDPLAKDKLARNLMSSAKDRAGRPIYKTIDEARAAIDKNGDTPAAPSAPGAEPAASSAPPARAQRGGNSLPMGVDGRPDATKLQNGQSYTFKTKGGKEVTAKWNAATKKFE